MISQLGYLTFGIAQMNLLISRKVFIDVNPSA